MKMKKLLSLFAGIALFGITGCSDSGSDKPAETTLLPSQAELALAQLCDAAPVIEITTPALTCQAPNCYAAIGARGGTGSYQIAVDGLDGLSVNNGVIQGNVAAGARTLNVTVTDSNCLDKQATGQVGLTIAAPPPAEPLPAPPPAVCGAPDDLTFINPMSVNLCINPRTCTWIVMITGATGPFTATTTSAPGTVPVSNWVTASVAGHFVTITARTAGVAPGQYNADVQITDTTCPQRQRSFPFNVTVGELSQAQRLTPAIPVIPIASCSVEDARVTFVTASYDLSSTSNDEVTVKFCKAEGANCISSTIHQNLPGTTRNKKETYRLGDSASTPNDWGFDCNYLDKIILEIQANNRDEFGWILEGFRVDAKINGTFVREDGTRASLVDGWATIYNNPSVFVSLRSDQFERNYATFTPNDTAVGIEIKTATTAGSGTDSNIRLHLVKKSGPANPNLRTFVSTFERGVPHWESDPAVDFASRVLDWDTNNQDDFEAGQTDLYGGYFPNTDPVEHKYGVSFATNPEDTYPDWKPEYFQVAFIRPGEGKYLEDGKCDGDKKTIDKWFNSNDRNWPHDFTETGQIVEDYYTPRQNVNCPFPPIEPCPGSASRCNAH